jgi:hypothetical protein
MNRQKLTLLALAGVVVLVAGAAAAQAPKPATPATPAAQSGQAPAARPRLVAPIRGEAPLGYTKPIVKPAKIGDRDFVVTTMRIKNLSTGSIAGLKVDEFWYNKAGDPVTGANYRHPRPLQPGEVITVTLQTPRNPAMDRNQYKFEHANGTIKMTLLPKL